MAINFQQLLLHDVQTVFDSLGSDDAESDRRQIDAAPSRHAMFRGLGALLDNLRKRLLLRRRQPRFGAATLLVVVAQIGQPCCVVAQHPVAQRLSVHATAPRRIRPRCAPTHHRNRLAHPPLPQTHLTGRTGEPATANRS
jgi:hypothetical protein